MQSVIQFCLVIFNIMWLYSQLCRTMKKRVIDPTSVKVHSLYDIASVERPSVWLCYPPVSPAVRAFEDK